MSETKQCGRIHVTMYDKRDGGRIVISTPDGSADTVRLTREEARDLHYMLGRMIDLADT